MFSLNIVSFGLLLSGLFPWLANTQESVWNVALRLADDNECLTVPGMPDCITSNNDNIYDNNVFCIFEVSVAGQLQAIEFDIEDRFDGFFFQDSMLLDEESDINGLTVQPGDTLIWATDISIIRRGWTICVNQDVNFPTPSPVPPLEEEEEEAWTVLRRDDEENQCRPVPNTSNCITSNIGGNYSNNVDCVFQANVAGQLQVVEFEIDELFDGFLINTVPIFPESDLINSAMEINAITLSVDDLLFWDTSFSMTDSGWTICIIPDNEDPPIEPPMGECCTINFRDCYVNNQYCNENEFNCQNECDGFWMLLDDDDDCVGRWEACDTSNDCCDGIVCLIDNQGFQSCGVEGDD